MEALVDGDVLLYASLWGTTSLAEAKTEVHRLLDDWVENSFCDSFRIALGDPSGKNFRDKLYPEYKQIASRVKARKEKPSHFLATREYLKELGAIEGDNIEADDLLGHWAGEDRVIVTVDKDLNQVAGMHYWTRKGIFYRVDETQADRFLLNQLLKGDPMDNIPGLPGVGPVKAERICSEYPDNTELARKVLELYQEKFNKTWQNDFLINAKLLYIQRQANDWFTLTKYRERFQLEFDDEEERSLELWPTETEAGQGERLRLPHTGEGD